MRLLAGRLHAWLLRLVRFRAVRRGGREREEGGRGEEEGREGGAGREGGEGRGTHVWLSNLQWRTPFCTATSWFLPAGMQTLSDAALKVLRDDAVISHAWEMIGGTRCDSWRVDSMCGC